MSEKNLAELGDGEPSPPPESNQCPKCTGSKDMALCDHIFHSPAGVRRTNAAPAWAKKYAAETWWDENSYRFINKDDWWDMGEVLEAYKLEAGAAQEVSPRTYTLIFMFTPDFQKVLLLKKATPEWQKGLWNGPGGIVETGESEIDGAVRELREEAAIALTSQELTFVLKFSCDCERFRIPDCGLHYVSVFAGIAPEKALIAAKGSAVEPVELLPVSGSGRVDYLPHLLALCVMRLKQPNENGHEEVSPPSRLLERLRDGLTRMRDGDKSGPSAQHMLEWLCQEVSSEGDTRELKAAPEKEKSTPNCTLPSQQFYRE